MSEWKWCLNCQHHFMRHQAKDGKLGPCKNCDKDCKQFEQEVANFL